MKLQLLCTRLLLVVFASLVSACLAAQTPGLIVRPLPPAASPSVLDPNRDGFTSPTNSGFVTTDVGAGFSEIPYRIVPPFKLEPTADLMRGPNDRFTDLVRLNADESGMYVFNDGTNMLFRLRLGAIVPGSKGYSILLDTDGKFGATGPNADPGYQAKTTGSNGNPGFELEVVLETNFRVAIYNVNDRSDPVLLTAYTNLNEVQQISLAISNVSGTPDYLYDFYVPLSALPGVTATTPLRISATTVMSPQAAIGGPKSDIYGYDGNDYMAAWEDIIAAQQPFTPSQVTAAGSGLAATLCTAAPTLNTNISVGTTSFSGTWTSLDASRPATATITLYKEVGATVSTIGSQTITSGNPWTINGPAAAPGETYYALAVASGESACSSSNRVTITACTSIPASPTIFCGSQKGLTGNVPLGTTVAIYAVSSGTASPATGTAITSGLVYTTGSTNIAFNLFGANSQTGNACQGQNSFLNQGTYMLVATNANGCSSAPVFICITGNNQNAWNYAQVSTTLNIATPVNAGQGSLSVTGTTNGQVIRIFNNTTGRYLGTATAAGSTTIVPVLAFAVGDKLVAYAQTTVATDCITASAEVTATCVVAPPVINDNRGQIRAGVAITGLAYEAPNTTINVFDASTPATPVATILVGSDSTWTTGSFTAIAGRTYYATAVKGCGVSSSSARVLAASVNATARCGTINPVSESTAVFNITGTLAGTAVANTMVRLYANGVVIDSTTTGTSSYSITVNQGYSDKVSAADSLTIEVQEPNRFAEVCATFVKVSCTAPAAPIANPTTAVISNSTGRTVISISNSVSGILYTLEDASGGDRSISVFGTGGTISLTSYPNLTPGTYNYQVSAFKLEGIAGCTNSVTPVTLTASDNDGDNIIDPVDIDDDNDGTLDTNESATYDATGDGDGDGVPNFRDVTPGVTGLPNTDSNSDGILDYFDTDGDGIINQFDLDADNDGIPDVLEAYGTDADNDGRIDGTTDTDGDGLRDGVDANTSGPASSNGLAVADFDGDGIPNLRDLDSDNDGALDSRESGLNLDTDNNGLVDGATGADGWSDAVDALAGPLALRNTDVRGRPNLFDTDSDDDGIVDNIELQTTAAAIVPTGADTDGDGIDNAYDNINTAGTFGGTANNGLAPVNTDGDAVADYLDLDADNDGFPDASEGHDSNGDNLPDAGSNANNGVGGTADVDGDGLLDGYDNNTAAINPTNGTTAASYPNGDNAATSERDWREANDADKDGYIDTVDTDDDNDGIADITEGGGFNPAADADGDGLLNYLDPTPGSGLPVFVDGNNDGISDAFDADRDGLLNSLDLDSDNDGIADIAEAGGVDQNGDGTVDFSGTWTVNDGNSNGLFNRYDPATAGGAAIPHPDTDGDGIRNAYDLDSDNDGIPDVVEAGGNDSNNDGMIDGYADADGDGFAQAVDGDQNNDNTPDNTAAVLLLTGADTNSDGRPDSYPRANLDGTGLPNPYDLDADGDGILDVREAGIADGNNDGIADGSVGNDGWSDAVDALGVLNLPNTDGSGGADLLDIDSDNDGITDNVEGQTTAAYRLPSGLDADADGIDDAYDNQTSIFAGTANNGIAPNNHDAGDLPDYRDTDTDNDGVNDTREGSGTGNGTLTNTADTDGDGLVDQFDTFNRITQTNGLENNVTIGGMGANGALTGPSQAGSNVTGVRTPSTGDRDWRNVLVLPVRFVSVQATTEGKANRINWLVTHEEEVAYYEVERSADGFHFQALARVSYKTPVAAANSYGFTDAAAPSGTSYYRIRQVDIDGDLQYSSIVSVTRNGTGVTRLLVYPNPLTTQSIIQLETRAAQQVRLTIHALGGQQVYSLQLPAVRGVNNLELLRYLRLPQGNYLLSVWADGQQLTFMMTR